MNASSLPWKRNQHFLRLLDLLISLEIPIALISVLFLLMIEIKLSKYSLIELLRGIFPSGICKKPVMETCSLGQRDKKLRYLIMICLNIWELDKGELKSQKLQLPWNIMKWSKKQEHKEKNGKKLLDLKMWISNIEQLLSLKVNNGKRQILWNGTQIISYLTYYKIHCLFLIVLTLQEALEKQLL